MNPPPSTTSLSATTHLPRIIVNADDFGLHPALNQAIELAHSQGLVTSASLMTGGQALADAVRRARRLPALDLGLHFALVGLPGLPATFADFFRAYARGQFPPAEVARRLRAQLNTALITHKLTLSHIDSHQHLHAFPPLMRTVCAVAQEYGIRFVRLPQDGPPFASIGAGRRAQTAALRWMCLVSRRELFRHNLRTTDHFAGMAVSGHLSPSVLAQYIQNARPGATEIVCHPGADNRRLSEIFPWNYNWQGELEALLSPHARLAADNRRARLIAWHEL